jgi:hypothetical protein
MSRSRECPTCGGSVSFADTDVKTVYCDYCGQPLLVLPSGFDARGGRAQLAETPTKVHIGDRVSIHSTEYDVIGRAQYRFEDGLFDQFYLVGQTDAWLEQDEGEFRLFTAIVPVDVVQDWDDLGVGENVAVAGGTFYTMEFGEGSVVGGAGSLPMPLIPGDPFYYVDGTWNGGAACLKYSSAGAFLLTGRSLASTDIAILSSAS